MSYIKPKKVFRKVFFGHYITLMRFHFKAEWGYNKAHCECCHCFHMGHFTFYFGRDKSHIYKGKA